MSECLNIGPDELDSVRSCIEEAKRYLSATMSDKVTRQQADAAVNHAYNLLLSVSKTMKPWEL